MKVLARVAEDASTWINPKESLSQTRLLISQLKKVLMLSSHNQHELVQSLKNSNLSDPLINILTSLIQEAPISLKSDILDADCAIGSPTPFEVLDAELALKIEELAGSEYQEFEDGTSNEEAYRVSFGRFARLATHISVLDPYAGHTVLSDNESDPWLLNQLLDEGCPAFTFVTTLPSSTYRMTRDDPVWKRKKKIIDAVNALKVKSSNPDAEINVQLYFADSKVFHNRRIKFEFNSGAISYLMEKGIASFSNENMEPEDTLSEISPASFDRKLQAIQEKMTKIR